MQRTCFQARAHDLRKHRASDGADINLSIDCPGALRVYAGTTMDTRARPTPVTTALRLCLHALLVGLLVLAALRATGDGIPHATAVVVLAGVMAALYAAGALAPSSSRTPGPPPSG